MPLWRMSVLNPVIMAPIHSAAQPTRQAEAEPIPWRVAPGLSCTRRAVRSPARRSDGRGRQPRPPISEEFAMAKRKVAIAGGGIAGLVCAKRLVDAGCDVELVEVEGQVGG